MSALPAGTPVTVYYDPRDPADSCLRPGLEGSDLFKFIFITPFNVIMIIGWFYVGSMLRARQRPAGGLKIREGDFETPVRVMGIPPGIAALLTAFALAFVLTFAVGFSRYGFHPPLEMMIGVWCLILLAAVGAAWYTSRRLASGRYDLVIRQDDKELILPAVLGRREPLTVHFADIAGVKVEQQTKKTSGRTTTKYMACLVIRCGDDPVQREAVAEWYQPEPAKQFVRWMREQLGLAVS